MLCHSFQNVVVGLKRKICLSGRLQDETELVMTSVTTNHHVARCGASQAVHFFSCDDFPYYLNALHLSNSVVFYTLGQLDFAGNYTNICRELPL